MELPPPEQVSVAAKAGYTHVGLRLIPVANQVLPPFEMRDLEQRLADSGIKVLDVEVFRLDKDTDVAAFEPVLAASARLGATDLLVHGADAEESRLVENFGRLCDLSARYGLAANIEPMPWVEISTIRKAKRIIGKANRQNAAALADAIHFFREDNSFADLKAVPHRYMQLCDARTERPSDMQEIIRQARGDRLFPGEGGLDLKGLLGALPHNLPISVEIPYAKPMTPLERARRALEATRKLLAAC